MRVAKWGNSLAVRLPVSVVDQLGLKEGDEVQLRPAANGCLHVERDAKRDRALETMARLAKPLPPGFAFDRMEANRRGEPE